MDKTIAKFTGSKVLPGDTFNKAYKVVAKMVLHDLGQGAYFSATVDRYADKHGKGQWVDDGGGCDHDAITANFPHLAKYVKWHLVNVGSGPMHYTTRAIAIITDCAQERNARSSMVALSCPAGNWSPSMRRVLKSLARPRATSTENLKQSRSSF